MYEAVGSCGCSFSVAIARSSSKALRDCAGNQIALRVVDNQFFKRLARAYARRSAQTFFRFWNRAGNAVAKRGRRAERARIALQRFERVLVHYEEILAPHVTERLRLARRGGVDPRRGALVHAAEVPLQIADAAASTASLAAAVAERGSEAVRGDAAAAALLSAAAARAAANLVAINLAAGAEDDLVGRARSIAEDAADSARWVLDL